MATARAVSLIVLAGLLSIVAGLGSMPVANAATVAVNISQFTFNPSTIAIQAGDTVTWTNNDLVIHTLWIVGPGRTTTALSPPLIPGDSYSFAFTSTGQYQYYSFPKRLWVSGIVNVQPFVPPNQPPTLSFTPSQITSVVGQSITLAISASDADGTISSTRIDWGDGTVETFTGTITSAAHQYSNTGTYVISVTVTDDDGTVTTRTSTATVSQTPPPSFPLPGGPIPWAIGIIGLAAFLLFLVKRFFLGKKPKAGTTSVPTMPNA